MQKTSFCLTSSRVDMRQRHVPTLFVALVLQKHISDIWLIQKLYPAICIFQSFNSQLLYGRNGKCIWLHLFLEKELIEHEKTLRHLQKKVCDKNRTSWSQICKEQYISIFLLLHKYSRLQNGKYPQVNGEIY